MSSVTVAAPPSGRDFEIHRLNRVEHLSTYRLAERFNISQTRVRQVVHRVDEWLACVLPAKSDIQREQETRLAQCLAADQLQSQIEKLQVFWDETRDPKFLRQQTRAILALARLGVLPGALDAAAADVLEPDDRGIGVPPVREEEAGGQRSDVGSQKSEAGVPRVETGKRKIFELPLQCLDSDRPEAYPTSPPAGDCSRLATEPREEDADHAGGGDVSRGAVTCSDDNEDQTETDLAARQLIEQRLLMLLASTPPDDHKGLDGLKQTLANIRRERATLEVRISAGDVPGCRAPVGCLD